MREWWLVGVAVAVMAAGYAADRVHQAAVIHAGTYAHETGTLQLLLAADRIPKLLILVALGWMGVRVLRSGAPTGVAWTLVGIGAVVGIVPTLALAAAFGPMPQLVLDVALPHQFVPWTGTGLVVVGLLGLVVDRLPARKPDGWIAAGAAVVLVAASWPVDAWFNAAFLDAAVSADAIRILVVGELVLRLAFMAALAMIAWLVLPAGRAPVPAMATLTVGLIAFIGLAVVALFVLDPSPVAPPGTDGVPVTGWVGRWVAGAILILGAWWMLRSLSTERTTSNVAQPTASGSGVD